MLGLSLAEATSGDFFAIFHLVADEGRYRPAGHRLRGLLSLQLMVVEDRVVEIHLALARAWLKAPVLQPELTRFVAAWAASLSPDSTPISELVSTPGWLTSQSSVELTVGTTRLSRRLSEDEQSLLIHLADAGGTLCSSCGTAGPEGARYCSSCGKSLGGRRGLWPFAR
ncbi:MAG: zinc-ribbon domain-containing protein [Vulcanimicrobiota bacterium]